MGALRCWLNCSANSRQLPNRSEGSLAIALANTGSSPADSGWLAPIDGGGALTWPVITTAGLDSGRLAIPRP